MARTYSTVRVAKLVGIHWMTLYRWLGEGKVRPSVVVLLNGRRVIRRWTDRDVEKVRKYKAKFYRKGRGRKPKSKR